MKELMITEEKQLEIAQMMSHPLFTPFPTRLEDSYRFGWARGIALFADTVYHGSWYKWLSILAKGEYKKGDPVPYVEISATGHNEVTKMLDNAMEPLKRIGYGAYEFLDWIGFSLGISWFKKPNIPEKEWKHLYETVDLSLFFQYPADYLGYFLTQHGQSGVLEFYPTPMHVSMAIIRMLESGQKDPLATSLNEPCLGTSGMILSSQSLNIVGSDLNPIMVRASVINAFFYKPSMLYVPSPVIGLHFCPREQKINRYFEFETDTRIYSGNSLLGEFTAPVSIFKEDTEFVDIYLTAADLTKHEIYQYEDELLKPWDEIEPEMKFKIVKAQARELGFDSIVTNPPFSVKLSSYEKEIFEEIRQRNKSFLAERALRKKAPIFMHIEKEAENKIEIVLSDQKVKNQDENQLMFVL